MIQGSAKGFLRIEQFTCPLHAWHSWRGFLAPPIDSFVDIENSLLYFSQNQQPFQERTKTC